MKEISVEKNQQLDANKKSIEKFFDNNVCDNIKVYVLGGTKTQRYVRRVSDYVVYINNILSLAFIFAHGCLRCNKDGKKPVKPSKQSSLRIINSLRKAYVQYPVTSELIQFVLSDIQFEMLSGNSGELHGVFDNLCKFSQNFSLTKYYKLISTWKAEPSRFSMDPSELSGMFLKMLKSMTFLSEYDLVQIKGEFFFIKKDGENDEYDKIPVRHHIYYDPEQDIKMFYSLYSVECFGDADDEDKVLGLRYVCGDGYQTVALKVGETAPKNVENSAYIQADPDDYYYEIIGGEWNSEDDDQETKKNSNFIDQVHAINYKYIKNLALSISDAISINLGSKRALYDAYHIRHKDIFGKITSPENIDTLPLDWDGIIVMLLIESSPTSVLETLFRAVSQTFLTITQNLCKRIDNPDMIIYGLTDEELHEKVDEIIRTKLILGETGGFGKIPRHRSDARLRARAEALLIVSSLSAVLEDENTERTICAGNIYDNISLLERMKKEDNEDQKCKYICIILGETFRHLSCFYKGIIGYGEVKGRFDAESGDVCFSEAKIASYQKKMYAAFMKAAKEEADLLKQYNSSEHEDMLQLIYHFAEICDSCSSTNRSSSKEEKNLYSAIGRHDILNIAEFKSLVFDFIKMFPDVTERNADNWISFALDVLRYLRTGRMKGTADSPTHAIYPFTATYNRGNVNYDGYKTVTFVLNINFDGDGEEKKEYINVLTEFTYNLSNVFYCLPNVLRSNRRWWIDPVLIDFKDFNEIFDDSE